MAENVKTIGSGGSDDYASLQAFFNDLSDGSNAVTNTTQYTRTSTAVAEFVTNVTHTAAFGMTSAHGVNLAGDPGFDLAGMIIRPASGLGHDGTFGSGLINYQNDYPAARGDLLFNGFDITVEDMEFQFTGNTDGVGGNPDYGIASGFWIGAGSATGNTITLQRLLMQYDSETGNHSMNNPYGINVQNNNANSTNILNCVLKDWTDDGSTACAIRTSYTSSGTVNVFNCTAVDCKTGFWNSNGGTHHLKNCISFNAATADITASSAYTSTATNYTSDTTGTTQTTQTEGQLFTNAGAGDYTPSNSTPSDLIDNGTDLADTPAGVDIDAAQYDRAAAATWDVGALEYVAPAGGPPAGSMGLLGVGI